MGACTYGAIPDPSKPASVYVSTADFQRWLGATIYGKLAPWVWEQGTQGYEVAALATLNPDVPGPITDLEVTIASSNPISAMLFASRLKAFGQYMAFAENCLCNTATPGWHTCQTDDSGDHTSLNAGGVNIFLDLPVPACAAAGRLTVTCYLDTIIGGNARSGSLYWKDNVGTYHLIQTIASSSLQAWTFATVAVSASWVGGILLQANVGGGSGTYHWHGVANWEANGVPSAPATAPLPTIPNTPAYPATGTCTTIQDVCNKLDQVLSLVSYTKRDVDIIQRQSVPFAYVSGATHAVTDHGEFAVADLLGLAVTFTSVPGRLPVDVGTPDTIWQLGRIALGTADGWQRNITLTHTPSLVVPVSGFVTKVGYTLPLGVAATITELKAEP